MATSVGVVKVEFREYTATEKFLLPETARREVDDR